jgi:excisionase family DNA binding protein
MYAELVKNEIDTVRRMSERERQWLSEQEAADLLEIHVQTLRTWRRQSDGPPVYRFGRRWRYDRQEVMRWIEQQRRGEP